MKLLTIAFSLSLFNLILFVVLASIPNPPAVSQNSPVNAGPTISALPSTKPIVTTSVSKPSKAPQPSDSVVVPTTIPTKPAVPTPDNRCIIVIDGNQYDVSSFRNQHSGGDIFQCGTDMSQIFHGRHDNSYLNSLRRI